MSKVYFIPTKSGDSADLSTLSKSLLDIVIKENSLTLAPFVPIKVHFGEPGNMTFIPAKTYDGIIDYLSKNQVQTAYIETNVLYGGERQKRTSHIAVAQKHGFDQIPIIIADGEIGEDYIEVDINQKYFSKCKIGAEYKNYSQYIICSHFKGHMVSGFGGALKQLGMGFAARGGKMDQHSMACPTVNQVKCKGCELCCTKCGVKAIRVTNKASIDKNTCIGCAGCIATCPQRAINHDWGGDNFNLKLAEYAYAASINKHNIYINYLINITKDCDCMGQKMPCIAENIGILASLDPVAIDTASLDILQKESKSKLFDSGRNALEYAEKLGMGEQEYEVVIPITH